MKKNVSKHVLLMAATAWPMMGHADGLVPENCTLGQRPEYAPIKSVLFTFDRTIGAVESASATIYLDDEDVAYETIFSLNHAYTFQSATRAKGLFDYIGGKICQSTADNAGRVVGGYVGKNVGTVIGGLGDETDND